MVFCNIATDNTKKNGKKVTILILIDGFLQYTDSVLANCNITVTILILIDGFLQSTWSSTQKS